MNFYTKEDYAKAYTEILEILQYIPREDLQKIPKDEIEKFIKNKDYNYKYIYDTSKEFEEQNIMHLTKILIANIYIEYIADENEKNEILQDDRHELYELEQKKKEQYDIDKIFKNRSSNRTQIKENDTEKSMMLVEDENVIKRILNKVKELIRKFKKK